jgi:DNA-binding PadR family transcriptional regulator
MMRGFPWFWRREGDAWEAMLHRGGPHGPRFEFRGGDPEGRRFKLRFGPDEPGEDDEESEMNEQTSWDPRRGRERLRRAFEGPPFGFGPFGPGRGPGRGERGGRGGWPFGPGFPPFIPPFGPPFGRGPKARRGDVRAAALALLAEQPRNGYQIIQEIAERSGGYWKPSSGSVYPALQQLEDEGLVEVATEEGRRTFRLTEAGQAYVEQHQDELKAPWETMTPGPDDASVGMHTLLGQVAMAVVQVSQAATPAQLEKARQVLIEARRALYQILAEDEAATID